MQKKLYDFRTKETKPNKSLFFAKKIFSKKKIDLSPFPTFTTIFKLLLLRPTHFSCSAYMKSSHPLHNSHLSFSFLCLFLTST
jgi:hypothetical protein